MDQNPESTPTMRLEDLVEMMKSGKPYIVPNEHFIFELVKVEIKGNYKIQNKVIPASEDIK